MMDSSINSSSLACSVWEQLYSPSPSPRPSPRSLGSLEVLQRSWSPDSSSSPRNPPSTAPRAEGRGLLFHALICSFCKLLGCVLPAGSQGQSLNPSGTWGKTQIVSKPCLPAGNEQQSQIQPQFPPSSHFDQSFPISQRPFVIRV